MQLVCAVGHMIRDTKVISGSNCRLAEKASVDTQYDLVRF